MRSSYARYQLLVKSVEIAIDHFPFGSGFASFASYFSGVFYSPLYSIYGISNVFGLGAGGTWFVSDSFWPMILAQFGWIGLFAFCVALLILFNSVQQLHKISHAYYTSGLSILAYLVIASAAESAFVNPLAIPLAIWLGVLLQMAGSDICRRC